MSNRYQERYDGKIRTIICDMDELDELLLMAEGYNFAGCGAVECILYIGQEEDQSEEEFIELFNPDWEEWPGREREEILKARREGFSYLNFSSGG